jgi:hypothetical protein
MQTAGFFPEQVVVEDHPSGIGGRLTVVTDDLHPRGRVDHQDFALPVELERGRADDQDDAFGNGAFERDNGLAGFSEPHVVRKERAFFRQKECDAAGLVRRAGSPRDVQGVG